MHTVAGSVPLVGTRDSDRTFFTVAAIANALIILIGFGVSSYARISLRAFGEPTLSTLVRLHAAIGVAWTVLLIVQARLIATRRTRLHRRLGIAGMLIAVGIVGLGWIVEIAAVRRAVASGRSDEYRLVILPLEELVGFAILVGTALWLRRRSDYHKRLMLLGTLALIPAATTRLFMLTGGVMMLLTVAGLGEAMFIIAMWVHDRRTVGRIHPATLYGGGILLVMAVTRPWVMGTDAWFALAKVLVG